MHYTLNSEPENLVYQPITTVKLYFTSILMHSVIGLYRIQVW